MLTKSDLADPAVTKAWLRQFQGEPNVTVFASTTTRPEDTRRRVADLSKALAKGRGPLKPIRALIAGVPNVGKSTLVNTLATRAVVAVGNKPAVTRARQAVKLADGVVITDSPGIMWPKIEDEAGALRLACAGSIPDTADDYLTVGTFGAEYLLRRYPKQVMSRYALPLRPATPEALLTEIGRARGGLRDGGDVDLHKAAEILVHGWCPSPSSGEASPEHSANWGACSAAPQVRRRENDAEVTSGAGPGDIPRTRIPAGDVIVHAG